jgi:hypothetical protein
MGRVLVHISEEDYPVLHRYCAGYYRIHDTARRNSIKFLLSLFEENVIEIEDHTLENLEDFFYRKKEEMEAELLVLSRTQVPDTALISGLQVCSDILSFLGDLEKLHRVFRRKKLEAGYPVILAVFSMIVSENTDARQQVLREMAGNTIDAVADSLFPLLKDQLGPDPGVFTVLRELIIISESFSRISPDLQLTEEIILLITPALLRKYGKTAEPKEIREILSEYGEEFGLDGFESVLGREEETWEDVGILKEEAIQFIKEPLSRLNEMVFRDILQTASLPDVAPVPAIQAETKIRLFPAIGNEPGLSLTGPFKRLRFARRPGTKQNHITVRIGPGATRSERDFPLIPGRAATEIVISPVLKAYYPLIVGVIVALLIISAGVIPSLFAAPVMNGTASSGRSINTSGNLSESPNATVIAQIMIPASPTVTPVPSPDRMNDSFMNRPVQRISGFGSAINTSDFITVFAKSRNYSMTGEVFSVDLKNPPMIVQYSVTPINITDVKWFERRDADKSEDIVTVTRPYEKAWFEVRVIDKKTGKEELEQGWGFNYPSPLDTQEFVILKAGDYRFELSGGYVSADFRVLVAKAGNVPA